MQEISDNAEEGKQCSQQEALFPATLPVPIALCNSIILNKLGVSEYS
jgi:hypothetical protein